MQILKQLIAISIVLYTLNTFADPAPLGITLNTSTLNDVEKTYRIKGTHPADTKGYYSSGLDIKNIDIETISDAGIISNSEKVVEGVVLVLGKSEFDKLYKMFSDKYKLVESRLPFVGDKFARFEDGESYIMLAAPHMGFNTAVTYFSKKYYDATLDLMKEEARAKNEKTSNML